MKYIINTIRVLFFLLFIILLLNGKTILWLALYVVSLLITLLFGRVYCGYICPMNTLMIPTEWLSKKIRIQTDKSPKWLIAGKFAWLALVGSVAIMLIIQKLLNKNIPILLIWLAISVIITLRYKPAVFHNLICPFGPLQKFFARFAKFSEKINKENCIGCKLCERVCPTEAIEVKSIDKKAEIETLICLQCTNCQQICPKNVIHYSK